MNGGNGFLCVTLGALASGAAGSGVGVLLAASVTDGLALVGPVFAGELFELGLYLGGLGGGVGFVLGGLAGLLAACTGWPCDARRLRE